jgi:Rod binding domain-containing protein
MRISEDVSVPAPTGGEGLKKAKLADAAQQFEATMLQELLKPFQHGQDSWGGEDGGDDTASDTITSFGTEDLAKAISKGGGFGIAKQIVSKVTLDARKIPKRKSPGTKVSGFRADTFK